MYTAAMNNNITAVFQCLSAISVSVSLIFTSSAFRSLPLKSPFVSASCCFNYGRTFSCKFLLFLALSCTFIIRFRIWRAATVEVLRDEGFSAINARSVAKKLGCSTQPIYFSFKTMDELKAALTQRAIELHTQRVRDSLHAHEGSDSHYGSYGMGFVKFAAEEKQMFRWLYREGKQPGAYQSDILKQEVIGVIVDEFGYAKDTARRFHQDMIYFTYGLATLANTDHLHLTETGFREVFRTLIAIYGKPAKLPEFAVKAGVVL